MNDALKYIVGELNKPPFNRNYSLISFDSIEGLSLLQVLTDVLAEIEPNQKVDVREEAAEDTAVRILNMLHILKYQHPNDIDSFRQGVVEGTKSSIYPLLSWMLHKMSDLKERAYLARYLVKLNVPSEILSDPAVSDVYDQYLVLIENFKESHREMKSRQEGGFGTLEIKKDIQLMQNEMEQIHRTIEKLKKKVEGLPNKDAMLALSKKIRYEADRSNKMYSQKQGQRNLIMQTELKVERQQQLLKERKQANIGINNQSLYNRLVEETKMNKYLADEKMPNELNEVRRLTNDIQRISVEPAIGQSYLDEINYEMKTVSEEINRLIEKKMKSVGSGERNQSEGEMYRQQASIVRNKKEAVGDKFNQCRGMLARLEEDYEIKRSKMGEGMIDHTEFRRLATSMRSMQGQYKSMKSFLAALRLENNYLQRSVNILTNQIPSLEKQLEEMESSKGVQGFHGVQEALEHVSSVKSELDDKKGTTMQDNSMMVQQLNKLIERKKSTLAPIIQQLRPLRKECQELVESHRVKKTEYEALKETYHSSWKELQQEVTSQSEAINSDESNIHYTSMMLRSLEVLMQRSEKERKAQKSDNKGPLRELLMSRVVEAEEQARKLKEKQDNLMDNQDATANQAKTWIELRKLMQAKLKLASGDFDREASSGGDVTTFGKGANRLIL